MTYLHGLSKGRRCQMNVLEDSQRVSVLARVSSEFVVSIPEKFAYVKREFDNRYMNFILHKILFS